MVILTIKYKNGVLIKYLDEGAVVVDRDGKKIRSIDDNEISEMKRNQGKLEIFITD